MPNEKKYALRYLLLRYFWASKKFIPKNTYLEITKSLQVEKTLDGFSVQWTRDGIACGKKYQLDEFRFFIRGDREEDKQTRLDHTTNDILAKKFIQEATGIDKIDIKPVFEPLFSGMWAHLAYYFVLAALMWLGDGQFLVSALMLYTLFALEFLFPIGRIIFPLVLLLWIQSSLLFSGIFTAVVYLLLQLIDPNEGFKKIRIILSSSAVAFGVFCLWKNQIAPTFDVGFYLVLASAIILFFFRWLPGSHFRFLPLAFPFLCCGLYLDQYPKVAVIGLVCAAIECVQAYYRFRLLPVQKEHSLTANG